MMERHFESGTIAVAGIANFVLPSAAFTIRNVGLAFGLFGQNLKNFGPPFFPRFKVATLHSTNSHFSWMFALSSVLAPLLD